ncbi:MAG: hypothetical protein AAF415_10965 [Pseudomonadota bacterium]
MSIHSRKDGPILLFYDGFEEKAIDTPWGNAWSALRGQARYTYRTLRKRQPLTGYYTAFRNLRDSLRAMGYEVRVNDFRCARAHPDHPVGISGYPPVYDKVILPNPAVFGPGHVPQLPEVEARMKRCNIQIMTLPSEWPCQIYEPVLGERVQPMFVGVDTQAWPDLSDHEKTLDCIVYDKIRWHRAEREADVMQGLYAHLDARGISHQTLRYGGHHLAEFRAALARARSLIFVCEHETQGLAYQEAMSSGVPVLAWEEGVLVDPHQGKHAPDDLVVSAVPYFDERCGRKFKTGGFEAAFNGFWQDLDSFRPRDYVREMLSFERAAKRYLDLYWQAGEMGAAISPETR